MPFYCTAPKPRYFTDFELAAVGRHPLLIFYFVTTCSFSEDDGYIIRRSGNNCSFWQALEGANSRHRTDRNFIMYQCRTQADQHLSPSIGSDDKNKQFLTPLETGGPACRIWNSIVWVLKWLSLFCVKPGIDESTDMAMVGKSMGISKAQVEAFQSISDHCTSCLCRSHPQWT